MTLVRMAIEQDRTDVVRMITALWPDCEPNEASVIFASSLANGSPVFLVAQESSELLGVAMFALRNDHVEGSFSSPTGYLEGIWVDKEHRLKGVGKMLVRAGEEWCIRMGCHYLGSDAEIQNSGSIRFHGNYGFHEVNRIVNFIKKL